MTQVTTMTQLGANVGVKRWGEHKMETIVKEIRQIHDMRVISPIHATPQQRRQALQYIIFLKEKRTGKIKGRGCADGQLRRKTMKKEEALPCTLLRKSVILSCLRGNKEGKYVAISDIPGTFLQCDAEDDIFLRIEGSMVQALLKIEPQIYQKHVVMNNR